MIFFVRENFCPYYRENKGNGILTFPYFYFMQKQLESKFQSLFIKTLKQKFPECIVVKNNPNYIQGIPDLTMFLGSQWFTFECKRSANESRRPNQEWYVNRMNEMGGHSYFVYPENMEEILNDIQQASKVF